MKGNDVSDKRIELEALITEREGMMAENQARAFGGYHPAYTEEEFVGLATKMRALKEER